MLRLALVVLAAAAAAAVASAQKNVEVTRTVDLGLAVVRAQTDIKATGVQGGSYVVSFPLGLASKLAYLQVVDAESEEELAATRGADA